MTRRTKKNRIAISILSLFLIFFVGIAYGKDPIVIGHVTDLTGTSAMEGPFFSAAIELAVEEYGGEIAGREIKVIHEDGGSNPTLSVDKARKLVEKDKASVIIGPINAGAASPIAGYLKRSGVPHIVMELPPPLFEKNGHVFAHQGTQRASGYIVGKYVAEDLGFKTATVIHDDVIFAEEFLNGAIMAFEEAGGTVVQRQRTPMNTMDYGPYLSGMKKADVCLFWFIPPHSMNFIKSYKEYGFEMPLMLAGLNIITNHFFEALGKDTIGITALSYNDPSIDTPEVKAWVKKWQEKFSGNKEISHPSMGMTCAWYVQAKLALEAIKATDGDTSPEALKKALYNMKLDTPWGPVSFRDNGIGIGNAYILQVAEIDGKIGFKQLKKYENVVRTVE